MGLRNLFNRATPARPEGAVGAGWYDDAYASTAEYREPWHRSRYYFLWCVIADRIRASGARSVLEVGCGPGQFARMLFDLGFVDSYLGLDFSPRAVEMAREHCPAGRFEVADARTSELIPGTDAGLIVCTEVLEHIEPDLEVIARWPSGVRCLCTVPNFPYESHVRHFSSCEEVRQRYSHLFTDADVTEWPDPRPGDARYYLLDGVRG